MNYQVEYKNQNWIAADIEAASPAEAAKLYLRRDSEMRWRDFDELMVCWGTFGRQSESFPIQDFLPLIGSDLPEKVIPGPLARLKHRLFAENVPAWFEDGAPCNYFGDDLSSSLRAVGWLAKRKPFTSGPQDRRVYDKLEESHGDTKCFSKQGSMSRIHHGN